MQRSRAAHNWHSTDPSPDNTSIRTEECILNKAELIDAAADRADIAKSSMSEALDAVLETITETVARGDKVTLTGFGTFERRHREARTGRNPQTGEEMHIPAQHSPAFKAGKAFKDAVAE
jgi:DNA-binding protein HU-beta